jgi:hypothetical protein
LAGIAVRQQGTLADPKCVQEQRANTDFSTATGFRPISARQNAIVHQRSISTKYIRSRTLLALRNEQGQCPLKVGAARQLNAAGFLLSNKVF